MTCFEGKVREEFEKQRQCCFPDLGQLDVFSLPLFFSLLNYTVQSVYIKDLISACESPPPLSLSHSLSFSLSLSLSLLLFISLPIPLLMLIFWYLIMPALLYLEEVLFGWFACLWCNAGVSVHHCFVWRAAAVLYAKCMLSVFTIQCALCSSQPHGGTFKHAGQ